MRSLMLALGTALFLTACGGGDDVSYLVGGSKTQYLSVQRERTWLWSDWQVSVVVSRYPDCVRRHHVKNVSKDVVFKVELYRSLEGGFILHQGKRWYVADTTQCQLQQFEEPPAEPGDLLGTFAEVKGTLQFTAEDAAKGKAAGS